MKPFLLDLSNLTLLSWNRRHILDTSLVSSIHLTAFEALFWGWKKEWAQQSDCGKKYEALISKTQNTTENTNKTTKIKNIMTTTNTYISVIILNINGLHSQIKRHRQTEWIEKQNPSICCPQETYPSFQLKENSG